MLALWMVSLAVADLGIFPDLDPQVELSVAGVEQGRVSFDRKHKLLVLWSGDVPRKVYPADPDGKPLRPVDAAELERYGRGAAPHAGDADRDGIPDELDLLIGARKVALNGAAYTEGYVRIAFPGGDVPRDQGVCTDTIVRALRNAGIDLQADLNRDLLRNRRAYPMVTKVNANIDHRRVKTLLPYFLRHYQLVDAKAPYQPGEVVFFDTFPDRPGPDHVGIVSDRKSDAGDYLVVNNWAPGFRDSDMDLLPSVPVLYRVRVRVRY
jgi:uncharacterized protein YijF (DUF1287 family)